MKSEFWKSMYKAALALSIGWVFVLAIAIGILIGHLLDSFFNTKGIFFVIFLLFGIAAGVKSSWILIKRIIKNFK